MQLNELCRYHHSIYCRLLFRYLEHKYKSVQRAERKYSTIMTFGAKLSIVTANSKEMLDAIDCSQLCDLLLELYQLKLGD